MRRLICIPSPSLAVAVVALFVALAGSSYAAPVRSAAAGLI